MHIARATGGIAAINNIALIRPKQIGEDLFELEIVPPPGGSLDEHTMVTMREVTCHGAEVARMCRVAPQLFGDSAPNLLRMLEKHQ